MVGRGFREVADFVVQVWTGGCGGEELRCASFGAGPGVKTERGNDVFSDARGGGGCERDDWDTGQDQGLLEPA